MDDKAINFCPLCGESLIRPEPLTLEELRKMDGDRVWTITLGFDNGGYELIEFTGEFVDEREVIHICNLEDGAYDVFADCYGKTWQAYRHKPKDVHNE